MIWTPNIFRNYKSYICGLSESVKIKIQGPKYIENFIVWKKFSCFMQYANKLRPLEFMFCTLHENSLNLLPRTTQLITRLPETLHFSH